LADAVTVISVAILVGTDLVRMTWALGGMFQLSALISTGLEILGAALGMVIVFYFVRAALRVEPIWTGTEGPAVLRQRHATRSGFGRCLLATAEH
jgi:hypothetical protein